MSADELRSAAELVTLTGQAAGVIPRGCRVVVRQGKSGYEVALYGGAGSRPLPGFTHFPWGNAQSTYNTLMTIYRAWEVVR